MVVTTEAARVAAAAHFAALAEAGVIVETLLDVDLPAALRRIAAKDVVTLLVEGGPALHTALAEADLVDRVQRVRTPVTLGGGVPASDYWRLRGPVDGTARTVQLGEDALTEFDVHRID
jgi:riboflavin biosynthesis pyrimidine reductase